MALKKNPSRNLVNENFVFIQAFQLYQQAREAEKGNFIKALNLYKQSLSLIDSIPEKFPSSSLAIKVAQRQIRLGRNTYASVRKRIAKLRSRAAREELLTILHDCALNLKSPEQRSECLADVAIQFVSNNQRGMGLQILVEAEASTEEIESPSAKNNSLSLLAVKYAEIEEFERALTLTVHFSEIADQIRLLTDLGVAYYEKKMRERARQLFNNALDLVERETDQEKKLAASAWIAFKLAESREFFWALEVCEAVQDGDTRVAIIHQVAERLIEFGKFATIQEIIKKIPDTYIRGELMASLVIRYSDDGYFTQARDFADAIEVPALKARAFLAMAREYKGKKLFQIGLDLIESAVKLAYKVPKIEDKVLVLTSAATLMNDFREERQACDLIRSALQEIECLDNDLKRAEFMNFLVKICLDIGQLSQARDIIGKIEDPDTRFKAMTELCAKTASLDNIAEAIETAKSIDDPIHRTQALFKIIQGNPDNRNFRLKSDLLAEIIELSTNSTSSSHADQILADCAMLLASFEKVRQAFQLLEKINDETVRNQLIWNLAELKFRSDFFSEGIEILRLIQNSDVRITRLIQVGLAVLKGSYPGSSFTIEDCLPVAFSFWLEEKEKVSFKISD
jgi:tetratricopeptide (TPR) repeat protein